MRYFVRIDRDITKAKILYEFLKQRNCRFITSSSLHYCVLYGNKPPKYYIIRITTDKEFIYESWAGSLKPDKATSLKDFIKQQGVITL